PPAVPGARSKRQGVQPGPDRAGVEQPLDLAVPGLEAEVLVDHEPHSVRGAALDHRTRLVERRRHWLLADDVDALFGGGLTDLGVGRGRGDDVDEVGAFALERFAEVGVLPRQAEALAHARGPSGIAVANGGDLDVCGPGPGLVVKLAEVPGTDGDAPEFF